MGVSTFEKDNRSSHRVDFVCGQLHDVLVLTVLEVLRGPA